ncbi:unnamed protein product [Bursaphelenchus okinawaensis]|uniref:Uncharacterized protein n=1 Tax=Bursaphelenchus okinawaensis TaxID=465554 RepID=A0A811KM97_9BILA|nr:unnamed protein product [Bursaphelenchus okinawaensis]CAG9105913.1 unnamed protein product [Bursaphelenchus okinawaensis]
MEEQRRSNLDDLPLSLINKRLRQEVVPIFRQRSIKFKKSERLRWYEECQIDFDGRYGHAMCYHESQNRIYVFGGVSANRELLDDLYYFCMVRF